MKKTHNFVYKTPDGIKILKVCQRLANSLIDDWQKGGIKPLTLQINDKIMAIPKRDIIRIEPIDNSEAEQGTPYSICSFGVRHKHLGVEGFEKCDCHQKFDMAPVVFEISVRKHYPKVKYASDITEDIRTSIVGKK